MSKPAGCGRTKNPFGAGAAACFAVANIFRSTFGEQLGHPKPDEDLRFSVLESRLATARSDGLTEKAIAAALSAPKAQPVHATGDLPGRPFSVALPQVLPAGKYVLLVGAGWPDPTGGTSDTQYGFTLQVP